MTFLVHPDYGNPYSMTNGKVKHNYEQNTNTSD